MINVSAYPLCAGRLHFQKANLSDPLMTKYWAAVCVAYDLSDVQLTDFGGFNFSDRSDANGKKLLKRLEEFLKDKAQRAAANSAYSHNGLRAMFGAYGVKTSKLESENDYWTVAEILFPGAAERNGGLTALYTQISKLPKKARGREARANLAKLQAEWRAR